MAGINMSGDLRNPSNDISVGTLAAVAAGSFLYLFFMVVLAGTCHRDALLTNYMIAEKVSALGFLLLSALYISSISSCLATLYGTPRVLQSIAAENTMPAIARLSEGKGPNKVPVNAILVISGITLVFIGIGEINRLATMSTMPFLITYGVIEYSYFVLCMQFDLNQKRLAKYKSEGVRGPSPTFNKEEDGNDNESSGRVGGGGDDAASSTTVSSTATVEQVDGRGDEEFEQLLEKHAVDEIEAKPKNFYSKFCNRWMSICGFLIKVVLMFLIHWSYSLLCIAICIGIWWYIGLTAPGCNPGIASEFSLLTYITDRVAEVSGSKRPVGPINPSEDQFVVTPAFPGTVQTKSSQLNDVNSDYAGRQGFHQTHTVKESRFK